MIFSLNILFSIAMLDYQKQKVSNQSLILGSMGISRWIPLRETMHRGLPGIQITEPAQPLQFVEPPD